MRRFDVAHTGEADVHISGLRTILEQQCVEEVVERGRERAD